MCYRTPQLTASEALKINIVVIFLTFDQNKTICVNRKIVSSIDLESWVIALFPSNYVLKSIIYHSVSKYSVQFPVPKYSVCTINCHFKVSGTCKSNNIVLTWMNVVYLGVPTHTNIISKVLVNWKKNAKIQLSTIYVKPLISANCSDPQAEHEPWRLWDT